VPTETSQTADHVPKFVVVSGVQKEEGCFFSIADEAIAGRWLSDGGYALSVYVSTTGHTRRTLSFI
jgi:hypothetical protein